MKLASTVLAAWLLLCLGPTVLGQTLVDVKVYEPSGDDAPLLGGARPRNADQAVGRSDGRFPGTPRITNGPAGIPERDTQPKDPGSYRGPGGYVSGAHGRRRRTVSLVRHEVKISILDGVAITTLDQTFHNANPVPMEGTYIHELPQGSVIDGFSIFMAGAEVHGGVYERERGRALYDEIVGERKDPGIVELVRGESPRIETRIFPILPKGEFRVKTRYTHVMQEQRGTYATSLPLRRLVWPDDKPIAKLGISLRARAAWPIVSVRAPEYDFRGLEDRRRRTWLGTFQTADIHPEWDLSIRCVPERAEPGLALHLYTARDGDRYFMAVVSAGTRPLTGAALDFGNLDVGRLYPEALPDLRPGRQQLVLGELEGSRSVIGRLTGREGDRAVKIRATPMDGPTDTSVRFVAAMWAVERVGELMADIGNAKPSPEAKAEIIALAERYGILTPYTVFFAR